MHSILPSLTLHAVEGWHKYIHRNSLPTLEYFCWGFNLWFTQGKTGTVCQQSQSDVYSLLVISTHLSFFFLIQSFPLFATCPDSFLCFFLDLQCPEWWQCRLRCGLLRITLHHSHWWKSTNNAAPRRALNMITPFLDTMTVLPLCRPEAHRPATRYKNTPINSNVHLRVVCFTQLIRQCSVSLGTLYCYIYIYIFFFVTKVDLIFVLKLVHSLIINMRPSLKKKTFL